MLGIAMKHEDSYVGANKQMSLLVRKSYEWGVAQSRIQPDIYTLEFTALEK